MTDEVGKPNQAESNMAESMYDVLREILELYEEGEKFSDAILIRREYIDTSPNTVRKNRQKLLSLKIIEQDTTKKYPNNEKFYQIKDLKHAEKLKEYYSGISSHNSEKRGLERSRRKKIIIKFDPPS